MKYTVTITETIIHEITVEARSDEEALQKSYQLFGDDEYDKIVCDELYSEVEQAQ